MLVAQPRTREQHAQVQVATAVLHQQQHARGLVAVIGVGQPDVSAHYRFHAVPARFLVEADQAEGVGEVGQGERAHAILGGGLDGILQADDAVHDGVFGMQAEVYEAGCRHRAPLYRLPPPENLRLFGKCGARATPGPAQGAWKQGVSQARKRL
ncbi:hypothetical protein D3C81_1122490 [compost metagenome]